MAARRPKHTRRAPMGTAANAAPRTARGRTDAPATPVAIRARGVEVDDGFDPYVRTRCGFKLGKFARAIERVSVRLEDVAGPKGAPAVRCAVKVVLSLHESVLVQVVEREPRPAFDAAIDSAERAVRRTIERRATKARRRS